MHPQIFLFSRTPKRDYQYLFPLPPQCPADCTAFIRTQLERMQLGKADRTMQVWVGESNAVILRLIESGKADLYSRPIYSLEGFYFSAEEIRSMWLSLPEWLLGFCAAPSLYQKFIHEEQISPASPEDLIKEFTAASAQFQTQAFTHAILDADTPISFSLDAQGMHLASSLRKKTRRQWVPTEPRRCRMQVIFDKKQKTARLQAVSSGEPEYIIAQSPLLRQKNTGWQFSKLEAAAGALEQMLEAVGWQYHAEGSSKE